MSIGKVYLYKGRPVYVTGGQYESNGRISNYWSFLYINEDGSLGEEGGDYGALGPMLDAKVNINVEIKESAKPEMEHGMEIERKDFCDNWVQLKNGWRIHIVPPDGV